MHVHTSEIRKNASKIEFNFFWYDLQNALSVQNKTK